MPPESPDERRHWVDPRYVLREDFEDFKDQSRYETEQRSIRWVDLITQLRSEMAAIRQDAVASRASGEEQNRAIARLAQRLAYGAGAMAALMFVVGILEPIAVLLWKH